jgi:hypothetical protein
MLQGDAPAIRLFIGAAALNVLSVAMTQAGWTHPWFVRGMFGLAALLTAASIGWPFVETKATNIPAINEALSAIASNRVVWFFVGIVPALYWGLDWTLF